MKCNCGYDGLAEIGNYPDERFDGKYKDMVVPFRCPKCKSNKNLIHINEIDSMREALINPQGRTVSFILGGADPSFVAYSITYPNGYGNGGTISLDEYGGLKKDIVDGKIKTRLNAVDCDTALRGMGVDPEKIKTIFSE